jgi:glycosyltransferase involved in cell wall biosynthesis
MVKQKPEYFPRILIISHNPLSDVQNNGKTMASFFENWPTSSVAQLFFTPEEPTFRVSETFFRVTDLDVLRKRFGLKGMLEGEVSDESQSNTVVQIDALRRNPLFKVAVHMFFSRNGFSLFLRSFFWRNEKWKSPKLDAWLHSFSPQLIFFQSSNCTFAFDVVTQISEEFSIPIIMQTTDDYVSKRIGLRFLFDRIYTKQLERTYKKMQAQAHAVIAISKKMAEEYRERFGGNYVVAMNSVDKSNELEKIDSGPPYTLVYAGNLGLNRWKNLLKLGNSLTVMSSKYGIQANLRIYSLNEPTSRASKAFGRCSNLTFEGAVGAEELTQILSGADMQVHVESFDSKNIATTRLSISTKIPEYLASGTPILAIGPRSVASIDYLASSKSALVVEKLDENLLAETLAHFFSSPENFDECLENAKELVRLNHLKSYSQKIIYDLAVSSLNDGQDS